MKSLILTEHQEQKKVVQYCNRSNIPIFANTNGTYKKYEYHQVRFKNEGLMPGVPDLMIPLMCGGYGGLFIEMKRIKGSVTSANQKKWIELLNTNGYKAVICKGAVEAVREIEVYLSLESI
jgi:hypothetical protein